MCCDIWVNIGTDHGWGGGGRYTRGERSPQDHYVHIFNKIKKIYHPVIVAKYLYNYSCLTKETGLECFYRRQVK